jgi:hypothetical protein
VVVEVVEVVVALEVWEEVQQIVKNLNANNKSLTPKLKIGIF